MMLTITEKRLLILFYTGFISETVSILRQALGDIFDPDERAAAESLILKLADVDDESLADFITEGEGEYVSKECV